MLLRRGKTAWATESQHVDPASLDHDVRCDVLVLGSGVAGALVAHRLRRDGHAVVAIDRRVFLRGSTAASTALLQYDLDLTLLELARKYDRPFAETAYRRSHAALRSLRQLIEEEQLDCAAAWRPSVLLAKSADDLPHVRREAAARHAIGIDARFVDAGELQDQFGIARPGAIVSTDAMEADPMQLVESIWRRAIDAGVRTYALTTPSKIERCGRSVRVTTRRGDRITCRHVVYATGYEALEQFPVLAAHCPIRTTFALATRRWPARQLWRDRALIWEHADPYAYARTTADNRVIIGGRDIEGDADTLGPAARQQAVRGLLQQLRDWFPQLAAQRAARAWSGRFVSSDDALPVIGPVDGDDRRLLALGYGGNGITFSVIAAEQIAASVAGRPARDAFVFSPDRWAGSGNYRSGVRDAARSSRALAPIA